METLESVLSSVRRNSFFVSIDLKDAYLSVPVNKNHRKYLKNSFGMEYYTIVML